MSKFWHILTTIGLSAISVVSPAIKSAVASHPTITLILASIWAILGNIVPSPVSKTP